MLSGFFDESGTDQTSTVIVAGFVGATEHWAALESPWNHSLAELEISKFHATECAGGTGEFSRLERWKRDYLRKALSDLLACSRLYAISNTILSENWTEAIGIMQPRFPHPYNFAIEMLIATLTQYSQEFWDGEQVSVTLAPQQQFRSTVENIWARYQKHEEGRAISSVTYAEHSSTMSLQAADLLSHELRLFHRCNNSEMAWIGSPLLSGLRTRGSGCIFQYHDDNSVRGVVEKGPIGIL